MTRGKSAKQIAREHGCAPSTVAGYLYEFGIGVRRGLPLDQRRGQVAYGEKMRLGKVVSHLGELTITTKLQEMRSQGMTYAKLVDWLNDHGIRTKNRAKRWDRPTVYKILKRHQGDKNANPDIKPLQP